ncbi:RING-H2 finger protein ATL13, partial [Momordica charantia]|uniref:RING-H2 finger protein ATL13 n=1 Tax=Momordica charantia TaxID=3673 RepID=A0A6J1DGM0_MOMCH
DCESRREFNFTESNRRSESFGHGSLRKKEEKGAGAPVTELSRRAFSFHFPGNWNRPRSENGVEMMMDEENQNRRNSLEIVGNRPSFVRRTMLWLMGRNSRIVHSSFTPNDVSDSSFSL